MKPTSPKPHPIHCRNPSIVNHISGLKNEEVDRGEGPTSSLLKRNFLFLVGLDNEIGGIRPEGGWICDGEDHVVALTGKCV